MRCWLPSGLMVKMFRTPLDLPVNAIRSPVGDQSGD